MGKVSNPLEWRKREANKKRIAKVATLRKYAQLCKQEGIQSNRVRVNRTTENDNNDQQPLQSSTNSSDKPKRKSNKPHQSSLSSLEQLNKVKIEEKRKEQEERNKERVRGIEEALHRRKEKRKLATAKNNRGQPLFKGKILNILEKLQKQ
eukprot:gene9825-10868_t